MTARRPRVKICGITRQSDAALAVASGADAIGFIFWPRSPRAIDPAAAGEIQASLPPFVTRVGVFVDASPDDVATVVRVAGLAVVQLHGDEPASAYVDVGARLMKVSTLSGADAVERVAEWPATVMPIIDASDPERRGGTGRTADWTQAARLSRLRPIVLAGGLTAATVAAAIAAVRPWAIDVSSGVEEAPGIKSPTRMREFFAALAAATEREEV